MTQLNEGSRSREVRRLPAKTKYYAPISPQLLSVVQVCDVQTPIVLIKLLWHVIVTPIIMYSKQTIIISWGIGNRSSRVRDYDIRPSIPCHASDSPAAMQKNSSFSMRAFSRSLR